MGAPDAVPALRTAAADAAARKAFGAWAVKHERSYATQRSKLLGADMEYEHRFGVFKDNLKHVEFLGGMMEGATWTLSSSGPFMDRTPEEFKAHLNLRPNTANRLPRPFTHADKAVPNDGKVDWRDQGAVTPIKNQGQCGSCWAFSTVGSMEGAHFLATGELVSLSEQELVSCDNNGDMGCNGGLMDNAFQWIIQNGGLDSEDDYPYSAIAGASGQCDESKVTQSAATISSFSDVPQDDEGALRQALSQQPVSVAVDAQLWQFYGGGVFNGVFGYCGKNLDHGVLLVAMDGDDESYTIKNSWGTTWGEKGYIRLPQNKGSEGMCGLAHQASYPVV